MTCSPINNLEIRVHMNDKLAVYKLSSSLKKFLGLFPHKKPPVILCIGTDRSTGDSLGPLTGWRLAALLGGRGPEIYGTVDEPVHAQNLESVLSKVWEKSSARPVVAVDACLGTLSQIGTVSVRPAPLYPGTALFKRLPPVGDISVTGIVNAGGFSEFQILQNTRLSHVLKMAQLIANSIYLATAAWTGDNNTTNKWHALQP